MSKLSKNLKSLQILIFRMRDNGTLEPGQVRDAIKYIKRLSHALSIKDIRQAEKAVDRIAKLFLVE